MQIIVGSRAHLSEVSPGLDGIITDWLTIQNPKWIEAVKMNRWTGNLDPYLSSCERSKGGNLIVPRGATRECIALCREHGVNPKIVDRRRSLPEVRFGFKGTLRLYQEEAVNAVLSRDFGTLQAATGAGKTVIGLAAIAARRQPALVVVHTRELLNQWIERIQTFLQIPRQEMGQIGSGKIQTGNRITVAMVQTLYKCAQDVAPKVGFLLVDECHRCPSRTFVEAVSAFDCRFMLGLSATPYRRDGLTKLIYWHLGELVHTVDKTELIQTGAILKAKVVTRETDFETELDPSQQYSAMLSELTRDPVRNRLIAADVAREVGNGGGVCLCLTDRKQHAQTISELLSGYGIEAPVLTGDTPRKEREAIVTRLNEGGVKVVCATGQLIGEGFDCKALQMLFLMTPARFSGRVIQYLGRVLRPAPGKKLAKIFDYIDVNVGVLAASARARGQIYRGQD